MGCGTSTPQKSNDHRAPTNRPHDKNTNHKEPEKQKDSHSNDNKSDDSLSYKSEKENDEKYYGYDDKDNNVTHQKDPTPPPPKDPTPPPPKDSTPPPPKDPTPPPPKDPTPPPPKNPTPPPPKDPTPPPPKDPTPPPPKDPTPPPPEEVVDDDTPFDDDGVRDSSGYTTNTIGLLEKTLDFRHVHVGDDDDKRPYGDPDNLYVDHEFPLQIAIVEDNDGIEWKRPKDFLEDPRLFTEGTTRFDIGQGSAGTCWFLSTVANIADNASMVKQVIPEGSYKIEDSEEYDGVFHARFYRFGKWEDVYVDDYLPVIYGNVLWGAKSATDANELWVALLEKAFARLYGSYDAIYGGQPGDAYLLLTGGIGERIELVNHAEKPKAIFQRIKNALNAGCQVSCVVPDEYDDVHGLVGGHAYSLVGVTQVNNTKLVRVRNPWGHGEWQGPWSDGSQEWNFVDQSDVIAPSKDDGEFYVCLEDFLTYFSQTTICSLTPDFDSDGNSDSLNHTLNLYGEWAGPTAAGFHKLLENPRFCFTVPEQGLMSDGFLPLVVQLVQKSEKRKTDNISVRCDVFRVLGDRISPSSRCIALEIQGKNNNVYAPELQSSFRHKLKPGSYIVVPSTVEGGQEKAFLLRLFTSAPLQNARQIPPDVDTVSCEAETSIEANGSVQELKFEKTLFGAFISDKNAGGQVSHRESYHLNPQYLITIPDNGAEVPLVVHIMQTYKEPQYPVGFRIFQMDDEARLPVDIRYLYDHYQDSPDDMQGSKSKFMISWDVDTRYLLKPGRYIGLVHLDEPNTEKGFAIVFKSTCHIGIKGYQTG